MRKYEIVLLIDQEVPHQGVAVIARKMESLLGDGGKFVASEYWGLRDLAYHIGNHKKARYFMVSVSLLQENVKVILDYLRINEIVIRSAVYAVDEFEEKHSHMLEYKKGLAENVQDSDYKSLFPNSISLNN